MVTPTRERESLFSLPSFLSLFLSLFLVLSLSFAISFYIQTISSSCCYCWYEKKTTCRDKIGQRRCSI